MLARFPHLLYTLRTLRQHPAYTLLNVGGLALALGCSLLLYWFVRFHQSFDTDQPQLARICRLVTESHYGDTTYSEGIPTPVGPTLRAEAPWLPVVAMSIGQENQYVRVLGPAGQPEGSSRAPYDRRAWADAAQLPTASPLPTPCL